MADLSEPLSALTLSDRLRKAVETFETRQKWSNQQWLIARIETYEAEAGGDAAASQRVLEDLASAFKFGSWAQMAGELQLSTPRDLLTMDRDIGQACTSSPVDATERDKFLQRLTTGINQVYDPAASDFRVLPLPEDYGLLLSITDGLRDNDLRGAGVCGVDGVRAADISSMAPDETEKLPLGDDGWRTGWELSTGFLLGRGKPPYKHWLVYYYCSRSETTARGPKRGKDEVKDSEREWKWRLFYKEPERFRHSFMHPMVFDGLVEWLHFYQEWWTRETKDYPEWTKRMKKEVEMLYPDNPEQQGEPGDEPSI